jgi:hypothetical protein
MKMGNPTGPNPETATPQPPQGGGGPAISYPSGILPLPQDALQAIYAILDKAYNAGKLTLTVELLTVNNTPTQLYPTSKPVKFGTFMNLSTTDAITITSIGQTTGKVTPLTAGQGYVMNPAILAGYGGGTFNFANIDLSTITAITQTNNAQTMLAVYYT